jgi:uncharacterized membrane protein YvbJ
MPFCKNCGKQNPETAKFCTGCGIPLLHSKHAPAEISDVKNIDIENDVKETSILFNQKKKSLNRTVILTLILIVLIIVFLSAF